MKLQFFPIGEASFNSLSKNIFLDGVISKPSKGECEVIVYSSEHSHTISEMPIERVELLVKVWIDRYIELYKNQNIKYVLPFENRGEEVSHPSSSARANIWVSVYSTCYSNRIKFIPKRKFLIKNYVSTRNKIQSVSK